MPFFRSHVCSQVLSSFLSSSSKATSTSMIFVHLSFVRSSSQEGDCRRAPRAWTCAASGLVLHLPGHSGRADRLYSERCGSADRRVWLLHHGWPLHADGEAAVLHGAAKAAATHAGCQQGPAAPCWYGEGGEWYRLFRQPPGSHLASPTECNFKVEVCAFTSDSTGKVF